MIDPKSGYHQLKSMDQDIPRIYFKTHDGHYEYLMMPFDLTNAPIEFINLLNLIFRPYPDRLIAVFINEMLIHSKVDKEYKRCLGLVL